MVNSYYNFFKKILLIVHSKIYSKYEPTTICIKITDFKLAVRKQDIRKVLVSRSYIYRLKVNRLYRSKGKDLITLTIKRFLFLIYKFKIKYTCILNVKPKSRSSIQVMILLYFQGLVWWTNIINLYSSINQRQTHSDSVLFICIYK